MTDLHSSNVLSLDHVSYEYRRGQPALRDVSFSIAREEIVALLGRNGAGKSTLLYLALGLMQPGHGTLRTLGVDPVAYPVDVKKRIGFVSELPMFSPTARASDILAMHRQLYPTWDHAFERELVERFALGPALDQRLGASKGQQQQLALLCAVCHRPDLLLLDEPAAGLDPVARREFLATALQLLNREGTGIIFSSHHLGDVERLGGRVVLLHDGTIALDAPLDTLREAHVLAVVPESVVPDTAWAQVAGVQRLRRVHGSWRAIVSGTAMTTEEHLRRQFGTDTVQCMALSLEELFVEYTA